jgi:hypothetical protein
MDVVVRVIADDSFFTTTGEINFIMDKGQQKSIFIEFYGLSNGTVISFKKSPLTSKDSDNYIGSDQIKFDDMSNNTLYLNDGDIKKVKMSVTADKAGAFSGNIFLQNNKNNTITKLPVTLETLLDWPLMIIIFMADFGTSALIWALYTRGGL